LWLKDRFISNTKLLTELVKRRDEVVKRAIAVANREMPENLESMPDTMEWVVEPHIYNNWNPYKLISADTERIAMNTVYSIMKTKELVEKNDEE